MRWAIETDQLSKTFQTSRHRHKKRLTPAVTEVSLEIPPQELFGLLGANGAGKTTLIKMLCTLILPTSGTAVVAGYTLEQTAQIRAAVGLAVADERSFYWRLSGYRNLQFFAALHGLHGARGHQRLEEVLAAVQMTAHAHKRFSDYSSGLKQRLAIARALLHQPQILFLDEPTRSLDPLATQRLHQLIQQLQTDHKMTIFLITHDLGEAEKLCQRVAVMHHGRIQTIGPPQQLRQQLQQTTMRYTIRIGDAHAHDFQPLSARWPAIQVVQMVGEVWLRFQTAERDGLLMAVLDEVRQKGHIIQAIEGQPPTLEEVFQHYTTPNAPTV